jgi:hypothetical protein
MSSSSLQRRFCVHGLADARTHGHIIEGLNFEDAALAYVAERHPPPDFDNQLTLDVEDLATGERQCFRIDLATGAAGPCD